MFQVIDRRYHLDPISRYSDTEASKAYNFVSTLLATDNPAHWTAGTRYTDPEESSSPVPTEAEGDRHSVSQAEVEDKATTGCTMGTAAGAVAETSTGTGWDTHSMAEALEPDNHSMEAVETNTRDLRYSSKAAEPDTPDSRSSLQLLRNY